MEVDHRDMGQQMGSDQPSVGNNNGEIELVVEEVVDAVGDGEAGGRCRPLHRRRLQLAASSPALVGRTDDEFDIVTGGEQRLQRRDGEGRGAEVGETHRDGGSRSGKDEAADVGLR